MAAVSDEAVATARRARFTPFPAPALDVADATLEVEDEDADVALGMELEVGGPVELEARAKHSISANPADPVVELTAVTVKSR